MIYRESKDLKRLRRSGITFALALAVCIILCLPASVLGLLRLSEGDITVRMLSYDQALRYDELGYPRFVPRGYDRLSAEVVEKSLPAITIENNYIKLVLLPEMGRVYSFLFKPTGHEQLWRAKVAGPLIGKANQLGWWLILGGVEYTLPDEEHGTIWSIPWQYEVLEDSQKAKSVRMWVTEPNTKLEMRLTISVFPDRAYYQARAEAHNPTSEQIRYQQWVNPMWAPGGGEITPGTEFVVPSDKLIFSYSEGNWWKPLRDKPSLREDVRYATGWQSSGIVYADSLKDGFFGAYCHEQDEGIVRIFDKEVSPGVKTWFWGNPARKGSWWQRFSTTPDRGYVELWGGVTKTFNDYATIKPGETRAVQEVMYPFKSDGGFTYANPDAVVKFTADPTRELISFAVSSARPIKNGLCQLAAGETILYSEPVNIVPGQVVSGTTELPARMAPLKLQLTLTEGKETLVRCRPEVLEPLLAFVSYRVVDDTNADGFWQPGEKATLEVVLRNAGRGHAEDVKAILSTSDGEVRLEHTEATFGHVDPRTESAAGRFRTELSVKANVQQDVSFQLEIADRRGHTWQEQFQVTLGSYPSFEEVTAGSRLEMSRNIRLAIPGDFDGDGDLDLFIGRGYEEGGTKNALFAQNPDGTFSEVSANVAYDTSPMGATCSDYDNDGDVDIFVVNGWRRPASLFRNWGDGTFADVALPARADFWGEGSAVPRFVDYDLDGFLDLVVGHERGIAVMRNKGDGTFTWAGDRAGLRTSGTVFAMAFTDLDGDGDSDALIANIRGVFLFCNEGNGTFANVTEKAGFSSSKEGASALVPGDFDNDGDMDVYAVYWEGAVLYRNQGDLVFTDATAEAGIIEVKRGFRGIAADFDNDGDLDIYMSTFGPSHVLLRNNGDGTFTDVASAARVAFPMWTSRLVPFDYNQDGAVDIFAGRFAPGGLLYKNLPGQNAWLEVELIGSESNRDGIGARVEVISGGYRQVREMTDRNGRTVHFGLGKVMRVDEIKIRWPSGKTEVIRDVMTNKKLVVKEGES